MRTNPHERVIKPALPIDDADLGTILALLRSAAGWTQDELAEASGLPSSSISKIEGGKIVPGLHTLQRWLGALGYPFAAVDQARTYIQMLRSSRRMELLPKQEERHMGATGSNPED